MEAILKFNLDDKDDLMKFRRACKSDQLAFFVWKMQFIDDFTKEYASAKDIVNYINQQLKEYNINIEEILE